MGKHLKLQLVITLARLERDFAAFIYCKKNLYIWSSVATQTSLILFCRRRKKNPENEFSGFTVPASRSLIKQNEQRQETEWRQEIPNSYNEVKKKRKRVRNARSRSTSGSSFYSSGLSTWGGNDSVVTTDASDVSNCIKHEKLETGYLNICRISHNAY